MGEMDKRDVLIMHQRKIQGYTDTPYFDRDSVRTVAEAFDRFVNTFDTNEMLAAAAEFANDEYVRKFMAENGMTFPQNTEEALDRGLLAVGEKMSRTHRTLQQNFMRMVFAFIQILALSYEAGIYDLRNEASCKMAHTMYRAVIDSDEWHLPMV